MPRRIIFVAMWLLLLVLIGGSPLGAAEPAKSEALLSWNESASKKSIVDFVDRVTREGGPDYVKPEERIATFDHDGTLWAEQPMYFQIMFAMDRVRALAPKHPDWKTKQPFKAVLDRDIKALAALGETGFLKIIALTHSGITTDDFTKIVSDWIATARHPRFNRLYTELVYQPMVELLSFLRANGFKTFIVSGGGVEFMRVFTERVYGIPPEQIVGSSGVVKYQLRPGQKPVLIKDGKIEFVDDGPGKPVGINRFIGRRPADAGMDCGRKWRAVHGPGASHRRPARVGLRPHIACGATRQGVGRSGTARLDCDEYENRMDESLCVRKQMMNGKNLSLRSWPPFDLAQDTRGARTPKTTSRKDAKDAKFGEVDMRAAKKTVERRGRGDLGVLAGKNFPVIMNDGRIYKNRMP